MATFRYRAVTATGVTERGTTEASSAAEVERALAGRGLYSLGVEAGERVAPRRREFRTRRADTVEALRYLATLVEAGFPLDRALGTVARVVMREEVAQAILDVQARVRSGTTLADAMSAAPRVFPRLAVAMSRAGERGGHLEQALGRLATHLEREERLREQVVSALVYPMLMVILGGMALLVLVLYVLPRFAALLGDAGVALPASTALVLATSGFVGHWWPGLLAGVLGMVALGSAYRRSTGGRTATDRLLLRVPIIGPLRQRLVAARLGRTLATLLGSGLPILNSLDVAAEGLADTAAAEEVRRAREELRTGQRLAPALGRGLAFPYVFLQMVALGEEGGRLPEMLDRGAAVAEQDLERSLNRLVRLVEPMIIVAFGGIIGLVALALLQAIYGVRIGG